MVMLGPGPLLFPVAAGPVRGPRYARLLQTGDPARAGPQHPGPASNVLDEAINATNRTAIPARSSSMSMRAPRCASTWWPTGHCTGEPLEVDLLPMSLRHGDGDAVGRARGFPARRPASLLAGAASPMTATDEATPATLLARLEAKDPERFVPRDEAATLVSHHEGDWHFHLEQHDVPGAYHFGVMVSGIYRPEAGPGESHPHDHAAPEHMAHGDDQAGHAGHPASCEEQPGRVEYFSRILSVSTGLTGRTPA